MSVLRQRHKWENTLLTNKMRHKQCCPNLIKKMDTLKDGREKTPEVPEFAVQAVLGKPGPPLPQLEPSLPGLWPITHSGMSLFAQETVCKPEAV